MVLGEKEMDECDNYVNPKGFCISHTPPSAYDQQGKDELKWSRMFAPIDAVASTDNVNGGVSSVHNLMTPQATGSNRKHQHRDDINRDRRNPRLGEGHVNMPLWQQTPQATGSNRKHQHRDDINRDRRNPRLGEGRVNMPLWQQAAVSPEGTVLSDQWHRICNSTSSVFVSSTISTPSASELVLCVSSVIKIQMDHDMCKPEAVREQFPYFKLDSSSTPNTNTDVPSLEVINTFVHDMFFAGGFSAECNIIALVYTNRVISSTGLPILQNNWQGIVCAAYLLAQKVWDDNSLNVKSFATIFPIFTLEQVSVETPLVGRILFFVFSDLSCVF